jgi:NIMA (never in mitosis gene a)-related kinase
MSLQDYEVLSELGKGAYSIVYKARRLSDNKIYALKKVKLANLKEKEKRNALNEVRFLASIKHPNVISYKEAFLDENKHFLCLVMEYADGGDLFQRIQLYQKKGTYMSESYVWNLVVQLSRGLKALHDLSIVHRDLKSANIFLTKDGKVKLGDMNVSKVSKACLEHTQTGTPYYASPEVWKDLPYDNRSDLWSFGCVLYESICLKPPFRAEDMRGLYKKVVKGEYSAIPRTFSQELAGIVDGLLQVDPNQRINCNQILNLPEVRKRALDEESVETTNSLLQTINFSGKMTNFVSILPKPNFDDLDEIQRNNRSLILPSMKNKSPRIREASEIIGKMHEEKQQREKSLDNLSRYRKIILKENYGALRLPKVKYPHGSINRSREMTIVSRVNSEKITVKPTTNRSLVAKRNYLF